MIPAIQRYIYEHLGNWPIKFDRHLSLSPLLRSNKEANGIVNNFWIGKVIFWFTDKYNYPCLVTKIMDKSVKFDSIKRCITIQKKINDKIGYTVFPEVFDIVELSGNIVIFQEAIKGPNYEIELSRAIYGPTCSLGRVKQVVQHQFKEIRGLLTNLQDMQISDQPRRWGDWAYRLGQDFRNTCGFNTSCLTNEHLDEMKRAIDSVPIYQKFILVEDHIANFLPGPRLVDQIHPNIDELLAKRPGVIDAFRFIIAYFRAGPIVGIFNDWLYAIISGIMDKDDKTIIGTSVRDLLRQVGFDLEQPKVIWAFVMATFFIRAKNEIEFHGENPLVIDALKIDFQRYTEKLVGIQKFLRSNKKFDFSPIIIAQDNFFSPRPSTLSELSSIKRAIKNLACEYSQSKSWVRLFLKLKKFVYGNII